MSSLSQQYPEYFERLFPYAVAFGLEKSWMDRMETYDIDPPYWYGYHENSNSRPVMGDFSQSFDVQEIKSVFTSYPQSTSSSSGGFSGGSAGGGYGGGGSSW